MRKAIDYIILLLKGMSMGAADVVPGVSGGTIALITGIYEELIASLKSFSLDALRILFRKGLREFWRHINGSFLVAVFSGILISIFSLARILKWLLIDHPVLVWSFFFGLIIASAIIVIRSIEKWDLQRLVSLFAGITIMVLVTMFSPAETTDAYWFVFLSGAIAVCAMILPGISGAFILLILGKYQFVLAAISEFDIPVIVIFGLGVIIGLLSFANFLSWLLKKYHDTTIAMLAGFIIGSVNKIWPWKETLTTRINSHGDVVPMMQKNILPGTYYDLYDSESHILVAILCALAGFILVIILERTGRKQR
jgi:putative membrane protein